MQTICKWRYLLLFDTKEEIVLACAEEAISRIEQGAFSIALEDIKDVANMMNHLGTLADELSPVMRFLVSVCVSQEYGNKVKPYLVQLAGRYPYYTKKSPRLSAAPQRR